jgi:glutamate-5-semialdehyde dehydrogenase
MITEEVAKAKRASLRMAALSTETKNSALEAMASALNKGRDRIIAANMIDMEAADREVSEGRMTQALAKRLKVDGDKIDEMISGIRDVAKLQDPVGETISSLELDEGLELYQIRCPIGVIGTIFESRPDVVPQIMALCLKSGNSVVFKGGSEAAASNRELFETLSDAAASTGVPRDAFVLMESREDVSRILKLDGMIDLLIPRGSNDFVRYIKESTKIPVLGHAAGICHVYVHKSADVGKALNVTADSKMQYPAVCNAAETLLVDAEVAEGFLSRINEVLVKGGVEVRADAEALPYMGNAKAASDSDWDAEYNDLILSVKVVHSLTEAIDFINLHGSHHTDSIIAEDREAIETFVKNVDSADIMVNASTRFADGYRFGKGAEVGISTNKVHSRGPVGMEGLTIYKYVLLGNGQVVKDYVGKNAKKYTHRKMGGELRF